MTTWFERAGRGTVHDYLSMVPVKHRPRKTTPRQRRRAALFGYAIGLALQAGITPKELRRILDAVIAHYLTPKD